LTNNPAIKGDANILENIIDGLSYTSIKQYLKDNKKN
jgi:hypothetical protein